MTTENEIKKKAKTKTIPHALTGIRWGLSFTSALQVLGQIK